LIGMPPEESFIGSDGAVHRRELDASGNVAVSLVVGYLEREFHPQTTDPRGEFLQLQRLAMSNAITLRIQPAGPANDSDSS